MARFVRGSESIELHHLGRFVETGGARRKYASIELARIAYDKALAAHRASGYVEAPDVHRDLDARRVLADEQLQRDDDDPLAHVIVFQDAIARATDPTARLILRHELDRFLEARHADLYGDVARLVRRPSASATERFPLAITWVDGFAEIARIEEARGHLQATTYQALMTTRIATHIHRLELGPPGHPDLRAADRISMTRAMDRFGTPPHLHQLVFEGASNHHGDAGDLGKLASAIPELEMLEVGIGHGTVGAIDAPHLTRLALTRIDPADLLRGVVPVLVDLELSHVPRANAFIEALARSPLLPNLRRLAIRHSGLGDSGLQTILMHERRYRHLEHLDLAHNAISRALVRDARDELPRLSIEPMSLSAGS